jgi:putative transposase
VVTVSVRREVVSFLKSRGHSERRACALAGLRRSTCQYKRRRRDPAQLVDRLRELAAERPRFGYRRLHVLLRREGQAVNRKRVYRLYKTAGLGVRRRTRRKLRASRPLPATTLTHPNERWSMDFVHDYLTDGRRLRTLNIVDAFTRECLAIEVDTSLPAARVVRVLGLIRFLGHLERGGYDGSSDGEWSEAGRWERAEGAASAA